MRPSLEVLVLVRVTQGYTNFKLCLRRNNPKDNAQMNKRWKPSVTVAAIIERDGRYMLIEEHTPEGLRLNNPAGHLDPGESPEDGCAREALEETTHTFKPTELVGIYISRLQRPAREGRAAEDVTYFRLAFCGELGEQVPGAKLDKRDFKPDMQFSSVVEAVEIIQAQPDPFEALMLVLRSNLDDGGFVFSAELIRAYEERA